MRRVNPKLYDRNYYLKEAAGYKLFLKSYGKVLDNKFLPLLNNLDIKNKTILDIGCGRGELVYWVLRNGARNVTGIDYSKTAVRLAKNASRKWGGNIKNKIKFIKVDAKHLNFRNKSFDIVFCVEMLEHIYPEEQKIVLNNVYNILKNNGLFIVLTGPSKYFFDYTYKYWCYPISSLLVKVNNYIFKSNYSNILAPNKLRNDYHLKMHINEPDYFTLKNLFRNSKFKGKIYSSNLNVSKPILGWKDKLFNFLVYLIPLSKYFPFSIIWGSDYYAVLKKNK